MSPVSPTPQKKPTSPSASAPAPAAKPQPSAPAPVASKAAPAPNPPAGKKPTQSPSGLSIILALGVPLLAVLAALIYYFGIVPRQAAVIDLDHEQKLNNQRLVIYAVAKLAAPKIELALPGSLDAFQLASIYARTDGYVKKWLVDIGDVVHENDLLAELDTPEVDQQLRVAKATAEEAKASLDIATIAADRWNGMVAQHAVSQEEADEKNAARDEAKATLDADLATVQRLTDLQNFKEIRAPFTGTITHRDIEVGNLVSAGNGTGTHELFSIAQTDPLRLYIDVPEANAPSIRPGVEANIHVAAYPDRVFHGEVVRSAGALDATTRTLHTEVRVPNPDGALLPGAFVDVRLLLPDPNPTILIPANALIVNSAGTQVALVENTDGHDVVRFVPVKVGRDFGTEVEILENVKEGDRLVTNPPADLTDGKEVTAQPLPPPPTPPPGGTTVTAQKS